MIILTPFLIICIIEEKWCIIIIIIIVKKMSAVQGWERLIYTISV